MKKLTRVSGFFAFLYLCFIPVIANATPYKLYAPMFVFDEDKGMSTCVILENKGETRASYALNYYGKDGKLIKTIDGLTLNSIDTVTRMVAKDLGLKGGKAQGSVEVCIKSGAVTGKAALIYNREKKDPCYFPLQRNSRTSLFCRCFNEVEVDGDGVLEEPGEVKTEVVLMNPNPARAKYSYVMYDDGKNKLVEGSGMVPGHGSIVFSPRAALKYGADANFKTKGSVVFEVSEGSLLGHYSLFNTEDMFVEVLKDKATQQVRAENGRASL